MTAAAVLTRHDYASRYVKRCTQCRQVRGNSSFRVLRAGQRSDLCQWCEEHRRNRLKRRYGLKRLRIMEEQLTTRLERLRRDIRAIENETIELQQENLFATRLVRPLGTVP